MGVAGSRTADGRVAGGTTGWANCRVKQHMKRDMTEDTRRGAARGASAFVPDIAAAAQLAERAAARC
jgi:hypothetical protein